MSKPIFVDAGPWAGHLIRTARKAGRCEYFRGIRDDRPASENGRCTNLINAGDRYLAGEMTGEAGGYGHDRYCMQCAGKHARDALDNANAHS